MGRLLIVVGAVVALLIFAGLFVAGAKLSPVVYAHPGAAGRDDPARAAAGDAAVGPQRTAS